MTTATLPIQKKENILVLLLVPVLLTFFLFFIDEGYYDLRWMKSGWNWFWFVVYNVAFLMGECIVNLLFLRKYTGNYKTALTSVLGIPLGVLLMIGLFYLF